jgi:hypothetical protein
MALEAVLEYSRDCFQAELVASTLSILLPKSNASCGLIAVLEAFFVALYRVLILLSLLLRSSLVLC